MTEPLETDPYWYRWLGIATLVALLDQLTKWYVTSTLEHGDQVAVLPVFSWVRWHNDGAAFSILSGGSGWRYHGGGRHGFGKGKLPRRQAG